MSEHDPEPSRIDTAIAEYLQLLDVGQPPDRQEFLNRYADVRGELAEFIDNEMAARKQLLPASPLPSELERTLDFIASPTKPNNAPTPLMALPRQFGNYRLIQLLGEGGMGRFTRHWMKPINMWPSSS